MTIAELKQLKESEDKVEFLRAENQYYYNISDLDLISGAQPTYAALR